MENIEFSFQRYTPQHPLPAEIKSMNHDETICEYCGISYLIHTEIKNLEDKLQSAQNELEHYRGLMHRETLLREENEKFGYGVQRFENDIKLKNGLIYCLEQENKSLVEASVSFENKICSCASEAEKYRRLLESGRKRLSELSVQVQQLRTELTGLRQCVGDQVSPLNFMDSERELFASFVEEVKTLQSQCQSCELERLNMCQENSRLTEILHRQTAQIKDLEFIHRAAESQSMLLLQDIEKENDDIKNQMKSLKVDFEACRCELQQSVSVGQHLQQVLEEISDEHRKESADIAVMSEEKRQLSERLTGDKQRLDKQLLENDDEIASLRGELELLGQQYAALKVDRESVTGQMALCTDELSVLRRALERAQSENRCLKNESDTSISVHHTQIMELRENFRHKLVESERMCEELRAELLEERIKHKAEIHVLELTLREGECANQKLIKSAERKHEREMADLSEARRRREEELLEQQGTLRHTVSRLQGDVGVCNGQVDQLTGQLNDEESLVRSSESMLAAAQNDLATAVEQIQFLQEIVQRECEERCRLVEALSMAKDQIFAQTKNSHKGSVNCRLPECSKSQGFGTALPITQLLGNGQTPPINSVTSRLKAIRKLDLPSKKHANRISAVLRISR